MYVGAALCLWMLRTWKIHDINKIARAAEETGEHCHISAIATNRSIVGTVTAIDGNPPEALGKGRFLRNIGKV
jgi:hypothetical protein